MSTQVSTAFVQQYQTNVQHLVQQRGSRLRGAVTIGSYTGKAAKAVEQIGEVTAQLRTSRHADTPLISTPHAARWVFPSDYEWADLIDDQDRLRMLIDPQSPYAQAGAFAMGRAIDDVIIDAFFGTAQTGENGTTATTFSADGGIVESSGTTMSVAKLIAAKEILMAADVDTQNEELFIVVASDQIEDLLNDTTLTSADYNTVRALVKGEVDSFMGFKFIHSERLADNGSSRRRCPAFAKSGMHLGIWGDVKTSIDTRPDKSNATQVYVSLTVGATRVEGKKVVEVLATE